MLQVQLNDLLNNHVINEHTHKCSCNNIVNCKVLQSIKDNNEQLYKIVDYITKNITKGNKNRRNLELVIFSSFHDKIDNCNECKDDENKFLCVNNDIFGECGTLYIEWQISIYSKIHSLVIDNIDGKNKILENRTEVLKYLDGIFGNNISDIIYQTAACEKCNIAECSRIKKNNSIVINRRIKKTNKLCNIFLSICHNYTSSYCECKSKKEILNCINDFLSQELDWFLANCIKNLIDEINILPYYNEKEFQLLYIPITDIVKKIRFRNMDYDTFNKYITDICSFIKNINMFNKTMFDLEELISVITNDKNKPYAIYYNILHTDIIQFLYGLHSITHKERVPLVSIYRVVNYYILEIIKKKIPHLLSVKEVQNILGDYNFSIYSDESMIIRHVDFTNLIEIVENFVVYKYK